jgi:hypothetical protein
VIDGSGADREPVDMKKRVAATLLWFYSMWYAGAMIATLFGLSPALGPILGTAAAAIVGGDPRNLIWSRPGTSIVPSATPAFQAVNPA